MLEAKELCKIICGPMVCNKALLNNTKQHVPIKNIRTLNKLSHVWKDLKTAQISGVLYDFASVVSRFSDDVRVSPWKTHGVYVYIKVFSAGCSCSWWCVWCVSGCSSFLGGVKRMGQKGELSL